jgi:hypothetical protein
LEDWQEEILKEYTDFLVKEGYCDDDVWTENPTARERFKERSVLRSVDNNNKLKN